MASDFGGSWVGASCFSMERIWIKGARRWPGEPGSKAVPSDSYSLVFILLCSFFPHWTRLTKLGTKRHWGLHLALFWIICSGEPTAMLQGHSSNPMERCRWQVSEVSCWWPAWTCQSYEWVFSDRNPPDPGMPSDSCSTGWLDYNFQRCHAENTQPNHSWIPDPQKWRK